MPVVRRRFCCHLAAAAQNVNSQLLQLLSKFVATNLRAGLGQIWLLSVNGPSGTVPAAKILALRTSGWRFDASEGEKWRKIELLVADSCLRCSGRLEAGAVSESDSSTFEISPSDTLPEHYFCAVKVRRKSSSIHV